MRIKINEIRQIVREEIARAVKLHEAGLDYRSGDEVATAIERAARRITGRPTRVTKVDPVTYWIYADAITFDDFVTELGNLIDWDSKIAGVDEQGDRLIIKAKYDDDLSPDFYLHGRDPAGVSPFGLVGEDEEST